MTFAISWNHWVLTIKGSHHIYYKEGVEEIINLQSFNNKAKAYQVKQVRELLIKEDNCFLAEVPELAGCMADGNSYTEALENVQTVINEWVETAISLDRTVPEPKGKLMYA